MQTSSAAPTPYWVLDLPFGSRDLAQEFGVRWNSEAKVSVYRGRELPHELEPFRAMPLSFEWHRQFALNGRHLELPQRLQPPFIARAHQVVAADTILAALKAGSPGFLLADEVGVGKTMGAWDFALRALSLKTVLVVTTASAQAHWRHTILHAGWRPDHRILIINYDRLQKLFAEPEEGLSSTRKKGKRKRVAKQGAAPKYDLVVFDESHKGKNPDSARGLMMRKIGVEADFCLWASATAGQNPVELIYLAPLLAKATASRVPSTNIADFAEWCARQGLAVKQGAFGKILWEQNPDDIALIHSWLFNGKVPLAIRRLPENIAGWPAMQRQLMPVTLAPAERQAYAKLWDIFVREEMQLGLARQKLAAAASGPAAQKAKVAALVKDASAAQEANRMRLRQQSSWLRIPSTIDLCHELLEQGKKVCISVAFRATQDEMQRLLEKDGVECAVIHGQLSTAEKERQRLLFQKGPAKVAIFTVEEAISLHQGEYENIPRLMLLHDLRWSAIQMAQIEGRAHRDGALAPVWWLAAEDTVEMDLAATMVDRVIGMKSMHGDPVGDLRAMEAVLQAAVERAAPKLR